MILGILSGFFAAFMQSSSYVLSKGFIAKNKSAFSLIICSQMTMGFFALLTLLIIGDNYTIVCKKEFIACLLAVGSTSVLGQFFFFLASKRIESSRISSFSALKIVILAAFSLFFYKEYFSFLQWLAIIICTLGAIGMNYSGIKISARSIIYLIFMLIFYCACDIFIKILIEKSSGTSLLIRSIGSASLSYSVLGIFASIIFVFTRQKLSYFKDSLGFSAMWFTAVISLFCSFSLLSVVFVNIIIATRGTISVLLGFIISKIDNKNKISTFEPVAEKKIWIRRFVMSVVMIIATALYSYASYA